MRGTTLTRERTAVDCGNCGRHANGSESSAGLHCDKCGRFAQEADEYCEQHDIDYKGLYNRDNHCPHCREERSIRTQEMHRATRDRRVEPW